jgi:hypothetical protein
MQLQRADDIGFHITLKRRFLRKHGLPHFSRLPLLRLPLNSTAPDTATVFAGKNGFVWGTRRADIKSAELWGYDYEQG